MADPTILVHEGNPRESSTLTVTGTLDGTPGLLINLPPPAPAPANPPPAPASPLNGATKQHSSCPSVFSYIDVDPPNLAPVKFLPSCVAPGSLTTEYVEWAHDIIVTSDINCCGIMYSSVIDLGGTSAAQAWYPNQSMIFRARIDDFAGEPWVGIVLRTDWDATTDVDTVWSYVLVYNGVDSLLEFYKFEGGSICDVAGSIIAGTATLLGSVSFTPVVGDWFQLDHYQLSPDCSGCDYIVANVSNSEYAYTSSFGWADSYGSRGTQYGNTWQARGTVGFVALAGKTGSIRFKAASNVSCATKLTNGIYIQNQSLSE